MPLLPQAFDADLQNEEHAAQNGPVQEWGGAQGYEGGNGAVTDYHTAIVGKNAVQEADGVVSNETGQRG